MKSRKKNMTATAHFDIIVNGSDLHVQATSFIHNEETKFRVSYNGSPVHIFSYNPSVGSLQLVRDRKTVMTPAVEQAIIQTLMGRNAA